MYPYLIQGKNIVVVIDNKSHTITSSHLAYEKIKTAIREGDWETVKAIVDPVKTVINYGAGRSRARRSSTKARRCTTR
jgi:CRISPR/Cas system CSM-associated protein Csm2 small subunit